jgi:hypothetical protein
LIEDLLPGFFDLVIWRILKVLQVLGKSSAGVAAADYLGGSAALQKFEFPQPLLQAFAAPAKRLVDGLGRGCESALQDGEREADRTRSLIVGERLGPIKLVTHVVGDFCVKLRLSIGKPVRTAEATRSGKSGVPSNFRRFSFSMRRIRSETSTWCTPSRKCPS